MTSWWKVKKTVFMHLQMRIVAMLTVVMPIALNSRQGASSQALTIAMHTQYRLLLMTVRSPCLLMFTIRVFELCVWATVTHLQLFADLCLPVVCQLETDFEIMCSDFDIMLKKSQPTSLSTHHANLLME